MCFLKTEYTYIYLFSLTISTKVGLVGLCLLLFLVVLSFPLCSFYVFEMLLQHKRSKFGRHVCRSLFSSSRPENRSESAQHQKKPSPFQHKHLIYIAEKLRSLFGKAECYFFFIFSVGFGFGCCLYTANTLLTRVARCWPEKWCARWASSNIYI